jgi:hypothetical protein
VGVTPSDAAIPSRRGRRGELVRLWQWRLGLNLRQGGEKPSDVQQQVHDFVVIKGASVERLKGASAVADYVGSDPAGQRRG